MFFQEFASYLKYYTDKKVHLWFKIKEKIFKWNLFYFKFILLGVWVNLKQVTKKTNKFFLLKFCTDKVDDNK